MSLPKMNSIYVSVEDMGRAVNFYTDLFGVCPEEVEKRYTTIQLGDMSFGLYDPKIDGEELTKGNNCVPVFEVENLDEEYKRVQSLSPDVGEIMDIEGLLRLFQFADSEGNKLEFYEMN